MDWWQFIIVVAFLWATAAGAHKTAEHTKEILDHLRRSR